MAEHQDGLYWVRMSPDAAPEVARCERGRWHVPGRPDLSSSAEIHEIGRPAKPPADAFEALVEDLNQGGLLTARG